MATLFYNGQLVLKDKVVPGGLCVEGGHITDVFTVPPKLTPQDEGIDAGGLYISPGFIDTHIHGGGGADVMDGSPEAVHHIAQVHAAHGLTAFLPTTLTASAARIRKACDAVRTARMQQDGNGARILGIHLEGPFLSKEFKGAQNEAYLLQPSLDNYMEISGGGEQVLRLSMAPELEGALELAAYLHRRGVLISVAHSNADYVVMRKAYEAGFRHITHFFNGMSIVQSPDYYCRAGVALSALELEGYMAEIISDGRHMPPEILRLLLRCKAPQQVMLTSDATRPADMPPGNYELGGLPVLVEDGVAMLADRTSFAGSVATADMLVRNAVKEIGLPLPQAIAMLSHNVARSIGLEEQRGGLEAGKVADVLLFDEDIGVQLVMAEGKIIYRS